MKKRSGDSSRLWDVSEMLMQKPPLGTPLDWENPLNKGTVLALAMNEGHGDKLQDLSLNGNHGTLNNFAFPPTVDSGWNPGQTGVGLNFESVETNYINCGNNKCLNPVDGLTIAVAAKYTSANTMWGIGKGGGFGNNMYGMRSVAGKMHFRVYDGVPNGVDVESDVVMNDGEWHWYVGCCNWSNSARLYIDGILQSDIESMAGIGAVTSTNDLFLAKHPIGADHFDGSIDQPRIQSRAWSAKEVKDYTINPWQVYLQP